VIEKLKASKTSEQILTITVPELNSYKAKANYYELQNEEWKHIYVNLYAVTGKNGIMYNRKQNTNTSPIGDFGFVYGFGIKQNPGIKYKYKDITNSDYWVTDPNSELYNRWSNNYDGWDRTEEEHLISFGYLYNYAMVIDFNYNVPVKGKGAAIFMHVASKNGKGTGGCIGLKEEDLVNIIKRLEPSKNPRIIITTENGLKKF